MATTTRTFEPQHRHARVNGIRMHYVEAGEGEPVVFLHGFPECWYSWRRQLPALAGNYRVIAPDLRGYHETEARPQYDSGTLQADVLGLLEALGDRSAHIVGHDGGGAVAWLLAMNHPEAVRSLAILNMPHPALFRAGLRSLAQLRRSWYIAFFQLPWLPERVLAWNGYRPLTRAISRGIPPWRRADQGSGLLPPELARARAHGRNQLVPSHPAQPSAPARPRAHHHDAHDHDLG